MEGLLVKPFAMFPFGRNQRRRFCWRPGFINAFRLAAVFACLIGACISALSERHVGGVKTSLVIAAVGGPAWVIAKAMFVAAGTQPNLQLQEAK
jgi:hypothetical protein